MRTVVITGSASGIGLATAEILRDRGDRVIGVDLHDAEVTADLTTLQGRAAMVEEVSALSGGAVDAVIANAGLALPIPATVAVNYFGALATLEGLRPLLLGSDAPQAALTSHASRRAGTSACMYPCSGIGTMSASAARCSSVASRSAVIGVSTIPGPMPLSGMPAPAHSAVGATRRIHRLSATLLDA